MKDKALSYVMLGLSVPMFLASLKFFVQVLFAGTIDFSLGLVVALCLGLIVLLSLVVKPLKF
jgi:hypothetical protein